MYHLEYRINKNGTFSLVNWHKAGDKSKVIYGYTDHRSLTELLIYIQTGVNWKNLGITNVLYSLVHETIFYESKNNVLTRSIVVLFEV